MSAVFWNSFFVMAQALGQIFVIALIAGILVRKKLFPDEYVKGLSLLAVNVLLPSMIFANTLQNFKPAEQTGWWILPLAGAAMSLVGLFLGGLFFLKRLKQERNILPIMAFQNAGYLILPIGKFVYPERFDEFSLYVFLFIMGFNAVLWSVGKYLLSDPEKTEKLRAKDFITVPLVSNITSVLLVLVGFHTYIPNFFIAPLELIGSATVPIATFVLGATIGTISIRTMPAWHVIARVLFVKLILLSAITTAILYYSELKNSNPLMCNLLVIEAATAPAANIIVMVRTFGGDRQKIGSLMLFSYAASLVTMPFWTALWSILN